MVDNYWSDLEWDFQSLLGLNAMDWVAGKRDWRQFYRFKEGLEAGSRYYAAKLNDPDIAEELARRPRSVGSSKPSLVGWTSLRSDLADIKDHLVVVAGAFGGGTPTFTPRPELLHEQLRSKASSKRINRMVGQLLPGQQNEGI